MKLLIWEAAKNLLSCRCQCSYISKVSPTMEWDSGAGHAVLKYAGGFLTDTTTNEELVYNKKKIY